MFNHLVTVFSIKSLAGAIKLSQIKKSKQGGQLMLFTMTLLPPFEIT